MLVFTLIAAYFPAPGVSASEAAPGDPPGSVDYQIHVSDALDFQNSIPLSERYIVSGEIFVLIPETAGVDQVRFFLDHPDELLEDPTVAGTPHHIATEGPFEFTNAVEPDESGQRHGFDTSRVADGLHTLTAALDLANGQVVVLHTDFQIWNGSPSLILDPGELSFKLHAGESASREVDVLTSDGETTDYSISADVPWVTSDNGDFTLAPDTAVLTINAGDLDPGSYTATVTATSSTHQSATVSIRLNVAAVDAMSVSAAAEEETSRSLSQCAPLACSEILVDLPYELDFSQNHGKILDGDGVGTGFTYLDQPSNGTGYIPQNLDVDTSAGTLNINTTNGIMAGSNNSQDNAIGVGIDAPSQISVLSTTMLNPPAGSGNFEQGGLWFGNDEDNYVKFEVISTPTATRIEFLLEVNGSTAYSQVSQSLNVAGAAVTLNLWVNPNNRVISGAYQINGGPNNSLGESIAPPEFFSFDAAGIDPTIGTRSFGGVFATHRNGSSPLTYIFDEFSITAEAEPPPSSSVDFNRKSFPVPFPTSLVWGPDNRLYVSELFGTIHAITLDSEYNVIDDQEITTLGSRLTLGIAIDPLSTPENVIVWAAHSNPSIDSGALNSSTISRLSGPGLSTQEDVITGLPRAIANHAVNSIDFGPDGRLYIAQGGNTGAGAANDSNSEFGTRAEQPLSAAVLVADVRAPGFDGTCATPEGAYAPAPCDVQVYASGLRNTYDFVWHSNGNLYAPDNGLGVTGTFPPSPTPPCEGFGDPDSWTEGGHNPGEQPDILNKLEQGMYYGHPNPYRNECVFKDGSYQGVAPLPNYVEPMISLGAHRSSNAIVEYTSNAFNGALKGELLITNYSVGDDIRRVRLSADGNSVVDYQQLAGGFNDPLPLIEGPGGVLFVGEFGGNDVTVLIPETPDAGPTGGWADKAPGPESLLDVGGTALAGNLYAVAGKTSSGPQRTMYIYDPILDSWSQGPDLPNEYPAVENPAVVSHNGKLYVFGGSTDPFSGATTSAAMFDPVTSEWTMLPPMSTGRGGATAQVIGDEIYVVGGMGGDGASLSSVEVFDPATSSWGTAPPMQTPRDNPGSAVLGGDLYVFGGRTREASGNEVDGTLSSVEMFDPGAGTWEFKASMPTGRRTFSVGTLNGRAQVMGGERTPGGGTLDQNEEYDPLTDSWRALAPMSPGRHGAATATIGGAVYVAFGGIVAGSSFSNINEAFSFSASGDSTPPAAPQNLTAQLAADDITIDLDWDDNSESDLAGYRVYRSEQSGGPYTLIDTVGLNSAYADDSAPAGVTVYYQVTAIDTSSNESGPSNEASETRPPDTTAPAAPAGLTATGTFAGIDLDWDDNAETDLAGYRIYRADQQGGPYTMIDEIDDTTSAYSDATVEADVTVYYQVTAFDTTDNESDPSSEVSAARLLDTEPPAMPTGLIAVGDFVGINLDWDDNTEEDLAGYRIYRAAQSGGPYTLLEEVGTTSSYTDQTVAVGETAFYQVTAFDTSDNESDPSNEAASTRLDAGYTLLVSTSPDRSNPIALDGQTVSGNIFVFTGPDTPNIVQVRFFLNDPDMSGPPYKVESNAPYDLNGTLAGGEAAPFNTTALPDEVVTITAALDLTGGSTEVAEATFTIDNSIPPPATKPVPGTIQAEDYDEGGELVGYHDTTIGNDGGEYRNDNVDIQTTTDTGGGYNVGWVRSGEWLRYTVDVAEAGTYDVTFRTATPNSNRQLHLELDGVDISGPVNLPNTGGYQNWTDATVTIEMPAGVHELKVVMDSDSFNFNYFTVEVSDIPPPDTTPPAAPTGLVATDTEGGIDLDWADNADADLAGYRIYRSEQQGGPYTLIDEIGAPSAYLDATAPVGVTVFYQVTAFDTSDNESGPSNEASATHTVEDTTAPAAPANLTATGTFDAIDLDWDDNAEADLAGYRIYRSSQTGGQFTMIDEIGTTSSYSDTTVAPGETAFYQVTAVDTSGNESDPSSEASSTRLQVGYNLMVSTSPDRSNPIALDGQTVAANIYVFTAPDTPNIQRVRFFLDDPAMTGSPFRTENGAPYDFNGSGSGNDAAPFNTAGLSNGPHTITASIDLTDGPTDVITASFTIDNTVPPPITKPVPGTIQAEDYDEGGSGIGYFDTSIGNDGGAYRTDNVDIQATTDTGGGYNVGWIRDGEWLRYTVDIAEAGFYDVTFRVATPNSNRQLHLELDDVDLTGTVALPNTGGYQNWTNVTVTVELPAGVHELKVVMDSDSFNFNYFTIVAATELQSVTRAQPAMRMHSW